MINLKEEFKSKRIKEGSLVTVVLFEGVAFNTKSSSYPIAYGDDRTSENPGEKVSGYVVNDSYQKVDLAPSPKGSLIVNLGGYGIYPDAIYSIDKVKQELPWKK